MIKKYAVVSDSIVRNIILWDGISNYSAGEGMQLVEIPEEICLRIGAEYINGEFINSPDVEE